MVILTAACRALRPYTNLFAISTITKTLESFNALPVVQRCYYRTKWEKQRTHKKPEIPKFDYSGDNTLNLPVQLGEDETVFSRLGINTDQLSDTEKKLFLIHNANSSEQMQLLITKVKEKFARDDTDSSSQELKIAMMTLHIRKQISHLQRFPKDKITKRKLVEAIQLRTKMLKVLRRFDLERFDWVLKELDLTYIPTTVYNRKRPIRSRVRQEAIHEMFDAKDTKLAALQDTLTKEREKYYSQKSQVMEAVKREQDALKREEEELLNSCIETGYPGETGEVAYKLAHIEPIDKVKWWRGHPKVIELCYGGIPPKFKGRVRKSQGIE